MKNILGALTAVLLGLFLFSPPAAARCWWHGHHRHCTYVRYHRSWVRHVYPRPFAAYQYYTPYRYQPYPYYVSYPAPPYTYNYHACFPFWPFCW